MPETSIIIRTYNEERHLPALFEGLSAQGYRDFETVVVDSGSFDMTREIARQQADLLVRISQHNFTFGHSLNVGIRQSAGRFVAMVSAHTLPVHSDWLARLVDPLRDERTAMVYGRQVGRSDSKFSEFLDFGRTFGPERKVLRPPDFFANNANSAIRRDLWERHPFDETLPGLEDIEWAKYWMERGYDVVYEPTAGIYHIHAESWAQVRRRYYREGQAARWIGIRHRRDLPGDVGREVRSLFGDCLRAWQQRRLREKAPEIARFRYEKLSGTCRGIWDGSLMDNPLTREKLLFDRHCKAVVIHGSGRASLDEVELPSLKPGEVLIKVAYEGICATDLEILDGEHSYYKTGLARYPIVPGHEFSGVIVAAGARVTHLREGDRVVAQSVQGCGECAACRKGNWISCPDRRELGVAGLRGGYAEYVVVPGRFVHRLPEDVDLKCAVLCEPLSTALKGLRRLERIWGGGVKTCAVVGVGPLGHLCARVLALRGHCVTVFDRNPTRLSYFAGSQIQADNDLLRLQEFDILVEATGDPQSLNAALHNSSAGTTLLLLGLPYARREFSFEHIVAYDKSVIGSVGSGHEDFEEAIALLPQLDLTCFVQQVVPLEAYDTAFSVARSGRYLKVLLEVDGRLTDRSLRNGQNAGSERRLKGEQGPWIPLWNIRSST